MPKKVEMIDREFGRLTVIEEINKRKCKRIMWKCVCECGIITIVDGTALRSGHTKSCGCFNSEETINRNTTHGMSKSSRAYKSWTYMISRCRNKKDTGYKHYGGRGIKIEDERWLKFEHFFADMGECPKALTIERRNNDLGYFKENCYWANRTIQARNTRLRSDNKTEIVGVCFNKRMSTYIAQIAVNKKIIFLGRFKNIEDAKNARIIGEQKYWGKGETHA